MAGGVSLTAEAILSHELTTAVARLAAAPSLFTVRVYPCAVVVEAKFLAFKDTRVLSEFFLSKYNEASKLGQDSHKPRLYISRAKSTRADGPQMFESVAKLETGLERAHSMKGFCTCMRNKSAAKRFKAGLEFDIDAMLGVVRICENPVTQEGNKHDFLVCVRKSTAVSWFPRSFGETYQFGDSMVMETMASQSGGRGPRIQNAASKCPHAKDGGLLTSSEMAEVYGKLWEARPTSRVYRAEDVQLFPLAMPAQFWDVDHALEESLTLISGGQTIQGDELDVVLKGFEPASPVSPQTPAGELGFLDLGDLQSELGKTIYSQKSGAEKFLSRNHYFSFDVPITRSLQSLFQDKSQHLHSKDSESDVKYTMPIAQAQHPPLLLKQLLGEDPPKDVQEAAKQLFDVVSHIGRSQHRFLWNWDMTSPLRHNGLDNNWTVQLIQGSVSSTYLRTKVDAQSHVVPGAWDSADALNRNTRSVEIYLIARREWRCGGTRYNSRGIDDAGAVANFVETELQMHLGQYHPEFADPWHRLHPGERAQLIARMLLTPPECSRGRRVSSVSQGQLGLEAKRFMDAPKGIGWCSFMQIRGSVPLFFRQEMRNNPTQPPPILSKEVSETRVAYRRHWEWLNRTYGHIFCFNLLSTSKGKEDTLTEGWREQNLDFQNNIHSEGSLYDGRIPELNHWDFHKAIKKDDGFYNALDKYKWNGGFQTALMHVGDFQERPMWTSRDNLSAQQGVFRTNCLDCLDRTNAFQYYVAWIWIQSYFNERGLKEMTFNDQANLHGWVRSVQEPPGDRVDKVPCEQEPGVGFLGGWLEGSSESNVIQQKPSLLSYLKATIKATDKDVVAFYSGGSEATGAEELTPKVYKRDIERWKRRRNEGDAGSIMAPLQSILSHMFADLGDRISHQYTATGSVITGMIMDGKSSVNAKLTHAKASVTRLYQNAIADSHRQICIEMISKGWINAREVEFDSLLRDMDPL